ncbi:MAG: YceI family protein [Steroidobacterales bacterium]
MSGSSAIRRPAALKEKCAPKAKTHRWLCASLAAVGLAGVTACARRGHRPDDVRFGVAEARYRRPIPGNRKVAGPARTNCAVAAEGPKMRIPKIPGEPPMHPLKLAATAFFMSVALATAAFAAPTTYTSDPNHTFVRFSYSHLGFSTQESRFNTVKATVNYDPAARTASVDVVVDAKSVDTGSDLFNGHIQGVDYLDTAEFSTATFKSTSVKFNGDAPASIEGNLTVKGVTKPVTLTVTSFKHGMNMMKKDAIGADATATVKRSDFNMSKAVPLVGDEVTLEIVIEAAAP